MPAARTATPPGSPTSPATTAQYIVTVSGGNLDGANGEVGLTFASGQNIADTVGNALTNTTPSGVNETYTVDNTAPTVTTGACR